MRTALSESRHSVANQTPDWRRVARRVDVACPDARQPAYRAVAGLVESGDLGTFHTAFYHDPARPRARWLRRWSRQAHARLQARLERRFDAAIPPAFVASHPWVDAAIAAENRLAGTPLRRQIACWRTRKFDRDLAASLQANRPDALLIFSDVGSESTLPLCRKLAVPVVLSVVHGAPDDERDLLDREAREAPEFFPLYLGDGRLDLKELDWLHERRRREARLADLILVPSRHLAARLQAGGIPADRIRVVPYAADLERFRPASKRDHAHTCTFVFAGGITQRKGLKYLLDAWRRVYRPGWRLHLVGAPPRSMGPLTDLLEQPGLRLVGPVAHGEMPARLAAADVFVFPSLFEGSAVVTYEALACGLPSIVTAESGAVARDGVDGLVVPAADSAALARAMARLGSDFELRAAMAASARRRAEEFTWKRYQRDIAQAIDAVSSRQTGITTGCPPTCY